MSNNNVTKERKDLKEIRDEIDLVDKEILSLISKRGRLVLRVKDIKIKINLPLYDPSREMHVYEQLGRLNRGPYSNQAVHCIFREIISSSRALERPLRLAYFGPEASFSHVACLERFGSSALLVPKKTVEGVFDEVDKEISDLGVVPIENSTEGVVTSTLDMLVDSRSNAIEEIIMPINLALLSTNRDMCSIRKLYSHPQALAQCRKWLFENLPRADIIPTESTSKAARLASGDDTAAAVASPLASEVYGLLILREHIEDLHNNMTRFFVIATKEVVPTGKDKTSILFQIRDEPRALYRMLTPFATRNINLTKIESRPSKKEAFSYLFFVDIVGHKNDPILKEALEEIKAMALHFKVIGSYKQV